VEEERAYSEKVWADEYVSLACQKAFYSYKILNKSQEEQIAGLDTREAPDGHIVVTKEEQTKVLSSQTVEARQHARLASSVLPTPLGTQDGTTETAGDVFAQQNVGQTSAPIVVHDGK
jgi:hypothetical protein